MPHAKSIERSRDESPDLEARIIQAIGAAGPRNVAKISRVTGAHQETVRYKIKSGSAVSGSDSTPKSTTAKSD